LPPPEVSTSQARYEVRNAAAIRLLDEVPNIRRSKPESILCGTFRAGRCTVQTGGQLYYADDDHLSLLGARLVVKDLLVQAARRGEGL